MIDLSLQVGRLQAERTVLARQVEELTAENEKLRRELEQERDASKACAEYFAAIERGAEANRRRAERERQT